MAAVKRMFPGGKTVHQLMRDEALKKGIKLKQDEYYDGVNHRANKFVRFYNPDY